jgi:hypothetical protein
MNSPLLIAGAGYLLLANGPRHRHGPADVAASKCERFSENPLPFPGLTPACRPPSRLRSQSWSWRRDSNPRPSDYKSDALPAELRQPSQTYNYRDWEAKLQGQIFFLFRLYPPLRQRSPKTSHPPPSTAQTGRSATYLHHDFRLPITLCPGSTQLRRAPSSQRRRP